MEIRHEAKKAFVTWTVVNVLLRPCFVGRHLWYRTIKLVILSHSFADRDQEEMIVNDGLVQPG